MNGKQSKKLRLMAKIFFSNQPPNEPKQSLDKIYHQLKQLHKIKK